MELNNIYWFKMTDTFQSTDPLLFIKMKKVDQIVRAVQLQRDILKKTFLGQPPSNWLQASDVSCISSSVGVVLLPKLDGSVIPSPKGSPCLQFV